MELSHIFGIDDHLESSIKINYYIEFVEHLENLAKIKENISDLEAQEDQVLESMDTLFDQNDQVFQEMVKLQSEEAKQFSFYADNLNYRVQL